MNDLSRERNVLTAILRKLEGDTSVPGYRGAMMAFIRLCERCSSDPNIVAMWRVASQLGLGVELDADAFAYHLYTEIWPKLSAVQKRGLAAEGNALADAYENGALE